MSSMEVSEALLTETFKRTREHSVALCAPLAPEDYVPQPADFVSPPKWHLAHTTWFFEAFVLKPHLPGYTEFHPGFAFLFNSYYNAAGDRILRSDRGNISRPTVNEVYAYREYVDSHLVQMLASSTPAWEVIPLLELGLMHEQQHQELLLTDLKYILGSNPLFPVYRENGSLVGQHNTGAGSVNLVEGVYDIGFQSTGFCYDNELRPHKVYLHACDISKTLVTNGEYLEFMEDGGYQRFDWWLDDGWTWLKENHVNAPLYWHLRSGRWHQYTLGGLIPVDPAALLCHVSFYEAAAYAAWKGGRLPTEFEWEAAAGRFSWGHRWEWTNSAYLPYPGFQKAAGAAGEYNGKFMVNQMVLRGASAATPPGHSRKTYRNFFHPHLRWQYTGIRLAYDR